MVDGQRKVQRSNVLTERDANAIGQQTRRGKGNPIICSI